MIKRSFGLGLVGAGSFGRFCLNAFRTLPDLNLVAVCDQDCSRLQAAASEFGMKPYAAFGEMLADPSVDIIAINTPPSSHAALSLAALRAGKHVFCEKPLATSLIEADAVLHQAAEAGVVFCVDYIMRANPLYRLIKQLGELQVAGVPVLGTLRRCSLENFAADEKLGRAHWFWDQTLSGGIFVEHGVHFFDLFGWQLGRAPKKVVALAEERAGGIVDTVQTIVSYEGGPTSSSFHTFTHANAGEFQTIIFGWDWAVAELHGWIALDLHLDALLDEKGIELLSDVLEPGAAALTMPADPDLPNVSLSWRIVERFPGGRVMRGHDEERRITARIVVEASLGGQQAKLSVYEKSVRAGLAAQLSAIKNGRAWVIPPAELWSSIAVAVAARDSAASGQVVTCPVGANRSWFL